MHLQRFLSLVEEEVEQVSRRMGVVEGLLTELGRTACGDVVGQ